VIKQATKPLRQASRKNRVDLRQATRKNRVDGPGEKGGKRQILKHAEFAKCRKHGAFQKSNHNASSCSFTATRSLELRQATRNRRQKAPANGRHTIEFNVVGCPANINLRQKSPSKSKSRA
jgi:hypothetical protein